VSVDAVEANSFPDLARRYNVYGVPHTVVGEGVEFVGARPESVLLQAVLQVGANGDEPAPEEPAS
jgi:predicted DsbA family dithiol-disulfide isomerase